MERPLVSVLMVNYNRETTVEECIRSVLDQTYDNIQMIVVDDGSTDRSWEIMESIQDERLELYRLEKNRHICYATNQGFQKVEGEYLARIDSDDVWYPDKLEKQLMFLQANPKYRICFSWIDLIDEYGKNINEEQLTLLKMFEKTFHEQVDFLRFFFFHGNCLSHPSVLMETSLMRETGEFTMGYMQSHDFDYWVRIAKKNPMYVMPERLLAMRRFVHHKGNDNNSNDSLSNSVRFYNEFADIKEHFFDDMSDQLFTETFSPYFRCKDSCTPMELECEKAFLLLKESTQKNGILPAGVKRFFTLFQCKESAELLERKYHFTVKDLYQYTGNHMYYDRWQEAQQEENKLLYERLRLLEEENKQLSMTIREYNESTSWKVTKPLRQAMGILKKR